jgi:ribosomal protein L12E/L44/L45/RPP1/RPP2
MPPNRGQTWQELFDLVSSSHERLVEEQQERWQRNLGLYCEDPWPITEGGRPAWLKATESNYLADAVRVSVATLTHQLPAISVRTTQPDDPIEEALIAEVLRVDLEESGAWDACREVRLDVGLYGIGALFLSWDPGRDDDPLADDAVPSGEQMVAEYQDQLAQSQMAEMVQGMGGVPEPLQPPPPAEPVVVRVAGEGPRARAISPWDLYLDPRTSWATYQRGRWMGRSYSLSPQEIGQLGLPRDVEEKLLASAEDGEEGSRAVDVRDPALRGQAVEGDQRIPLLEVWFRDLPVDGRNQNVVCLWSPSAPEEPLLIEPWPYTLRNQSGFPLYPYFCLWGGKVPRSLRGISVAELAEPQQREINLLRSLQLTAAWQARQRFATRGKLTEEQREAWEGEGIGNLIEELGTPIEPVVQPPLDAGVYAVVEAATRDLNAHTGVTAPALGIDTPGDPTATEVRYNAGQGSVRAADDQREWEEYLVDVLRGLWALRCDLGKYGDRLYRLQAPPNINRIDPASGLETEVPKGETLFEPLRKDHLKPADVTIEAGSTMLRDTEREVQGLIEAGTAAANLGLLATPMQPLGVLNGEAWLRQIFARLHIQDLEELFDVSEYAQLAMLQGQAAASAQEDPDEVAEREESAKQKDHARALELQGARRQQQMQVQDAQSQAAVGQDLIKAVLGNGGGKEQKKK